MKNLNINESFICRIWEGAKDYLTGLKTTDGEELEVIEYGRKNFDSGPDYLDAVIKIGGKIQNGHVEVHQDFKHWFDHDHPSDRKYVSVILQVVLWDSKNRKLPKLRIKRDIPTVVLAHHLKYSIHHIWQEIINKPGAGTKLPCAGFKDELDTVLLKKWFASLADERLKLKAARMRERLDELGKQCGNAQAEHLKDKNAWQQVLLEFVFEALGFSKNKEPMMKLARFLIASPAFLPLGAGRGNLLHLNKKSTSKDELVRTQAILFGLSGLLFDVRTKDPYTQNIKALWIEAEAGGNCEKLSKSDWHFFRLRPQNFPTKRIAYGSQFILKLVYEDLLKDVIVLFQNNELEPKEIYKYLAMFLKPAKDEYWNSHYNFGKLSAKPENLLGLQRIDDIIVNVITPFVYLYADIFSKQSLRKRVIEFYHNLRTYPDNSIVKLVSRQVIPKDGPSIDTPAMEQAAIQLYNFYCTRERCNECDIGKKVFKDSGYEYRIIYF